MIIQINFDYKLDSICLCTPGFVLDTQHKFCKHYFILFLLGLLYLVNHNYDFAGVWKGLFARIIMIGTLTALQWFIYDSVKVYFRLPRPPPPEMPENLKRKLAEQQQ